MSRSRLLLLVASLSASSAAAEDRAPFFGTLDKQVYVSETEFPGKTGNQTLCARVTDWHILYVPWQRTVSDYFFSDGSCQSKAIHPIPAKSIAMFKAAGILPDHVSLVPSAPLSGIGTQKGAISLLVLALLGFPLLLRQRMRRAARLTLKCANDPVFCDVLLTLLFHTAQRDGAIDKTELRVIMRTYKELTGGTVTPEMAAEKFSTTVPDESVLNSVKRYRGQEAAILRDSAILVATHQGTLSREKLTMLTRLNEALAGDTAHFREIIESTLHHKATYPKSTMQTA